VRRHAPILVSIIALVFASIGAAVASDQSGSGSSATASKAKKGPPGPRGPRGKTGKAGAQGAPGVAGPTGPAGAAGAKGDKGDKGDPGDQGPTGPGVTPSPASVAECPSGGVKLTPTPSGTPTKVCNGLTGFTDTLPSGKTETGGWSVDGSSADAFGLITTISFAIPLKDEIPAANVHYIGNSTTDPNCASNAEGIANPTAAQGHLCVYEGISLLGAPTIHSLVDDPSKISRSGALLTFAAPEEVGLAFGTWAVSAP
jgi:hypothetical protein